MKSFAFLGLLLTSVGACVSQDHDLGKPDPAAGESAPRSGLAEDARIIDLSDADLSTLCSWWDATLGGTRTQTCNECDGNACTDWDVSVASDADCVAQLKAFTCGITVAQAEDCAIGQAPDLCASPDACTPVNDC